MRSQDAGGLRARQCADASALKDAGVWHLHVARLHEPYFTHTCSEEGGGLSGFWIEGHVAHTSTLQNTRLSSCRQA